MLWRRISLAVSLALLLAAFSTFTTGFLAAALDLNRFAYHKYAAYVVVTLATVHVILHRRILVHRIRRFAARNGGAAGAGGEPAPAAPAAGITRRAFLWTASLLAAAAAGYWWSARTATVALGEGEDLGQVYHRWSMPSYAGLLAKSISLRPQPSLYKNYPGSVVVALPAPPQPTGPPLEEVIVRRRSVREYGTRTVTLDQLSRLLAHSAGITDRRDPSLPFRAAPSAGALYPVEMYSALFRVEAVPPGIYHYDVFRHRLELVRSGDFRAEVFQAVFSQEMVQTAALAIILTAVFARLQWKYADRSYRYALIEAGHLGQNVYLMATGLGLGACAMGAFFDEEVNRLLEVDGRDEAAVYTLAVGALRGT